MKKSAKIITGFLGITMFLFGLKKFFEPSIAKLQQQVILSELPFPDFTIWATRIGELLVGLALIFLAFFGNKLNAAFRQKFFYASHLMLLIMMLVATYVHLHPAVPSEYLPIAKAPYFPGVYILIVVINMLFNRNSKSNKVQ